MRKSKINFKESKKLLVKVGKYYEVGHFKKALTYTNRSIRKDPKNAEAHFVKGNVFFWH